MKALVTGATGFVGGLLAERLAARGHTVTALVRDAARAEELRRMGVRLVVGDLLPATGLAEAVDGQDVVFHVAGAVKARSEAEFVRVNVDGTRHILGAAERVGVPRFVHLSSLAACGPAERGRPLSGGEPERPRTPYGRSKLAGEQAVRETALAWTIVRPPVVYGPRDREFLRVFRASRLGFAVVFGDGRQELSAVFGPDLAEALESIGEHGATVGRTYYACHNERFTSETLAREIGRAAGREDLRVVRVRPALARLLLGASGLAARFAGRATLLDTNKLSEFFAPAWTADPGALQRDTGWSASHDLRSGLAATAVWYRERGWLGRA